MPRSKQLWKCLKKALIDLYLRHLFLCSTRYGLFEDSTPILNSNPHNIFLKGPDQGNNSTQRWPLKSWGLDSLEFTKSNYLIVVVRSYLPSLYKLVSPKLLKLATFRACALNEP
jgi:hypothetical protein